MTLSGKIMALRRELRPALHIALPLVLAEIGWMNMSVVDTIMVGRLPNAAVAIGAASMGSSLYYTVGIFGSGLLARRLGEIRNRTCRAIFPITRIASIFLYSVNKAGRSLPYPNRSCGWSFRLHAPRGSVRPLILVGEGATIGIGSG